MSDETEATLLQLATLLGDAQRLAAGMPCIETIASAANQVKDALAALEHRDLADPEPSAVEGADAG